MMPISLEDARTNARVTSSSEDGLLEGWIQAACEWVESQTGHLLYRRTVTETFAGFGDIYLKAWPIAPDATVTVAYNDVTGTPQSITGCRVAAGARPARLLPAAGISWPFLGRWVGPVSVTVQAGYANSDDVPAALRSAMLVIVKGLYDDRELTADVERAAARLCRRFKKGRL